jgi:predicted XRE-type DNA-binding protein
MARKNQTVTRGSGNIFADLGLPDADEHMLKARVVMFIDKRIAQLGLTQQAAADRMGISQSDVSKMLRGRFENFSLERLLRLVRLLGSDVEIKVTTRSRQRRRRASPLANDAEGHDEGHDAEGQHEGRMSLMMA